MVAVLEIIMKTTNIKKDDVGFKSIYYQGQIIDIRNDIPPGEVWIIDRDNFYSINEEFNKHDFKKYKKKIELNK